jgi:hypothetical protein
MIKYICTKSFQVSEQSTIFDFYEGKIYFINCEFKATDATYYSLYNSDGKFILKLWVNDEINNLITLAEFREQRINKILA